MAIEFIFTGIFSLVGVGGLWYGFNRMSKYRLMADTPTSKIRSMAIGIVELNGSIVCLDPIKTPFSNTDCVYFKYKIEEYKKHVSRDSEGRTHTSYSWDSVASGSKFTNFYAKDDTGQVLVNPKGAEFKVDYKKYFLQKAGIFGGLSNLINILKNFDVNNPINVSKLNLQPMEGGFKFGFNRVGDRRYYEGFLEPKENIYLIGTAANEGQSVLIKKGSNEKSYMISNKSEKELSKSLKWAMIGSFIFGGIFIIAAVVFVLYLLGLF